MEYERESTEDQAQRSTERDERSGDTRKDTSTDTREASTGEASTTSQPEQTGSQPEQTGGSSQQVLDELTKKQQEADANAKKYGDQSQALKADITALQRAQGETGDTATAYGKARPSLEQQKDDLKGYIDKKRPNIVGAVGPKKGQVDAAATAVQNEATGLENRRKTQWTESVTLAKDRLGNERYLAAAREGFDAEKARQNTIKGRLTRLTELQKELDLAEEAGLGVKMYAVLMEFDRQLELIDVELEPVDDYREDLEAAWGKLSTAQGALRDTTQTESEKQRQLQATKDELTRLESNRVDEILKRVPEETGTATGTGTGAGSGTGTGAAATTPPA